MPRPSLNRTGYLTLRQAAAWLGIGADRNAARRLLRLIRTKERDSGARILRRTGGGHFRVTKCALRQHFPEHWNRRNEVLGIVKERLKAVDEVAYKARIERRAIAARVRRNSRDIKTIQEWTANQPNGPQRPMQAHRDPPVV